MYLVLTLSMLTLEPMSWHLDPRPRVTWVFSRFIIRAAKWVLYCFPYLTLLSLFYTDHDQALNAILVLLLTEHAISISIIAADQSKLLLISPHQITHNKQINKIFWPRHWIFPLRSACEGAGTLFMSLQSTSQWKSNKVRTCREDTGQLTPPGLGPVMFRKLFLERVPPISTCSIRARPDLAWCLTEGRIWISFKSSSSEPSESGDLMTLTLTFILRLLNMLVLVIKFHSLTDL